MTQEVVGADGLACAVWYIRQHYIGDKVEH
jgi:hypothetical protein